MKAYIITLKGLAPSEEGAARCIESAKEHGFNDKVFIFEATDKYDAPDLMKKLKLQEHPAFAGRNHPPVLGCFLSHYRLWNKCMRGTKPILVLEHDSLFVKPWPTDLPRFKHVLNVGIESWVTKKNKVRDYPEGTTGMVPSRYRIPLGTHGYAITPAGAKKLILAAHRDGMLPADQHIRDDVIDLQEWLPNPIQQYTTFSTIRDHRGAHVIAPVDDWTTATDVWATYDKKR